MAWSRQLLSVADPAASTAFDDNLGLFIPKNEMDDATVVIWTQGGDTTDADESDVSLPGFQADPRTFDEFPHKTSKPDAGIVGASNSWWVAVDFGAANEKVIDSAVAITKNVPSLGGGIGVTIEVADSADFTTNAQVIAADFPAVPAAGQLDPRIGFYVFDDQVALPPLFAYRYSDVRYLRWRFFRAGSNFIPEIHQLIVGQRAQLLANPLTPFDAQGNASSVEIFSSRGGADRVYERYQGKGRLTTQFRLRDATEMAPIEDVWRRSDRGTNHVIFAPCPNTDPQESLFVHWDPPDFFFPFEVRTDIRAGAWDFVEQGPPFVERER